MPFSTTKICTFLTILLLFFHLIDIEPAANTLIGILLFFSFLQKEIIQKLKNLFTSVKFWLFVSPFLILVISLMYTPFLKEGLTLVQLRLPLLIFPFVFGLVKLSKTQLNIILKSFVLFVSLLPLIGFLCNIPEFVTNHDTGVFYNDNLVFIFNKQAVYFGLYINLAILSLFYFWFNNLLNNKTEKYLSYILLALLLTTQYLLASRVAIGISLISVLGGIILLGASKIGKKRALIMVLLFGASITFMSILFPKALNRFKSISSIEYKFDNPSEINHFNGEIKTTNWNGLNTRAAIWHCAWDEIKKQPILGGGIGSSQHNLMENYATHNFHFAIKSNYNSHNQYLDVLLTNGFVGLFVFLLFLGGLIYFSTKENNWLLFGFVIIFIISCLTENILSRNQGVMVVALFLSLLTYWTTSIKKRKLNIWK